MDVIVTGAAGALGQAVVERFAADGGRIACIDRLEGGTGADRSWFLAGDLADPDLAQAAVGDAADWLGRLDAVILLAGAFEWKPFGPGALYDWRRLHRANVETAVGTVEAVLPRLQSGASIIVVGAASAEPAGAGMGPYAAAKSAVARLAEALAQELGPQCIRANAILPSIIDTPRNRADMPDADFAAWTTPQAIADVIHFLASPASRAINGASIPVTNGR